VAKIFEMVSYLSPPQRMSCYTAYAQAKYWKGRDTQRSPNGCCSITTRRLFLCNKLVWNSNHYSACLRLFCFGLHNGHTQASRLSSRFRWQTHKYQGKCRISGLAMANAYSSCCFMHVSLSQGHVGQLLSCVGYKSRIRCCSQGP